MVGLVTSTIGQKAMEKGSSNPVPLRPAWHPFVIARTPRFPVWRFLHPLDVVKDPDLDLADKQQILASWASDASAVEGRPSQRWLPGTDAPVHLAEIQDALRILERRHGRVGLTRANGKNPRD